MQTTSPQTRARAQTLPPLFLEQAASLTAEEWNLIVEALGAYRHHSAFRAVYNKIKAGQAKT